MNQDIVHESRYVVHPAVHTATKLECAYNALECSICGRISRKIPIETEANHKVIQVESQEATCGTSGHGAGTRCISEDCAFNTQGGGATAYNTSAPTGHHTFEYRNLTTNEKVANDQNAVQINVCKTCGTQSEDKPYLTLAEVFETSDVVVIYGDFYARNMTIPVGKTLIVYGSFVLYQGNVNNGNLYYKNLMKSNIASITKDGTLISESNEASVKDIIEKAQSLREFEKPVDTP